MGLPTPAREHTTRTLLTSDEKTLAIKISKPCKSAPGKSGLRFFIGAELSSHEDPLRRSCRFKHPKPEKKHVARQGKEDEGKKDGRTNERTSTA